MKEDGNHHFKAHTPQASTLRFVSQLHATRAFPLGHQPQHCREGRGRTHGFELGPDFG